MYLKPGFSLEIQPYIFTKKLFVIFYNSFYWKVNLFIGNIVLDRKTKKWQDFDLGSVKKMIFFILTRKSSNVWTSNEEWYHGVCLYKVVNLQNVLCKVVLKIIFSISGSGAIIFCCYTDLLAVFKKSLVIFMSRFFMFL